MFHVLCISQIRQVRKTAVNVCFKPPWNTIVERHKGDRDSVAMAPVLQTQCEGIIEGLAIRVQRPEISVDLVTKNIPIHGRNAFLHVHQ